MNKRSVATGVLLFVWLIAIFPFHPGTAYELQGEQNQGITLLTSDQDRVIFELQTPDYSLETRSIDAGIFQTISVPEYNMTYQPGWPQLPTTSVLLGVPPDSQIQVRILEDEYVVIDGTYSLSPAPTPGTETRNPRNGHI
jgi:hypothetical protein